MPVSIKTYQNAVLRLQEALQEEKNDFVRDSVIQRFEFTVELAWKTAKRVMATQESSPKQVVREMGRAGLTDNVELWLRALDERNLSSHTYNEEMAERLYQFADNFLAEAISLSEKIKSHAS